MAEKKSLDTEYFKKVYEANDDPWDFETSEYEAKKYEATLASLPKKEYENALEIGCSIGVLTELLAKRCKQLLATDISDKALEQAKKRCADKENVTFQKLSFAEELPSNDYDLIMISEVAYYLSLSDWESAIEKLYKNLAVQGNIALIHWLPIVHDYPQTGDEVHHSFERVMQGKMKNVFSSRAENYRIDVWEKLVIS